MLHYRRTFTAVISLGAAMLLLPLSAHATPSIRDDDSKIAATAAPALDRFTVTLHCDAGDEDEPGALCAGTLHLKVRDKFQYWEGAWPSIGNAAISVPVGTQQVEVPTPGLAAQLSRKPSLYIKATVVFADGGEQELSSRNDGNNYFPDMLPVSRDVASTQKCGLPSKVTYSAAKPPTRVESLTFGTKQYDLKTPNPSRTKLDKRYRYIATRTTKVKVNGLTYTVTKGSYFNVQCVSSTSSGGKLHGALLLTQGQARVTGAPNSKMRVAAIQVLPGLFSTASRGRADFTVKTNGVKFKGNALKKIYATVTSKRGAVTAYQRLKIDPSAHCTPGKGVYMRMDGYTKTI